MILQRILFKKSKWTIGKMEKWLDKNYTGTILKITDEGNYYHVRTHLPNKNKSYVSKKLSNDIILTFMI